MKAPATLLALATLVLLAACGRPLSPPERAFATELHGDTVNLDRVRFVDGAPVGSFTFWREARPRLTCRERIVPPPTEQIVTASPGAVALFNRIFVRRDIFAEDYLRGYPSEMHLAAAMFFAHEMTHVWQWQNRATTGYHPLRAASEHGQGRDPYLFDITTNADFLDYGYEQQASIVEEYVCCRSLDPVAPRTARLHDLIAAHMPVSPLTDPFTTRGVWLPWDGAQIEGICR